MGDPSGKTQEALRVLAHERIRQGLLPRVRAARTWGGLGSGLSCCLCEGTIHKTEPEFELQFDGFAPASVLRFHRVCHLAWDIARYELSLETWTPVDEALPPADTPVEARLDLGESRSLILTLIRRESGLSAQPVWINATTRSSLPDGWRPIAWRIRARLQEHSAEPASSIPKSA